MTWTATIIVSNRGAPYLPPSRTSRLWPFADRSAGVWHDLPAVRLGRGGMVRYYLDEDVELDAAPVMRALGPNVLTTKEAGRQGTPDRHQLVFAAEQQRVLVTRNHDDFLGLTRRFLAEGLAHAGVLVVTNSFAQRDYGGIARAIARYDTEHPSGVPPYFFDFLTPGRHR